MAKRIGKQVIEFPEAPCVISSAAVTGKTESEGPLSQEFDFSYPDDGVGCANWNEAEAELLYQAVDRAIEKRGLYRSDIDLILAGDLLNQCTASTFGAKDFGVPFAGLFGACSTMAYAMALAAVLVDGKGFDNVIAATSSHFCSAEKQFRFPLEYGGQRAQTAQRTVTGAAACVIGRGFEDIMIRRAMFGTITDYGIKDAANMGAAMAPAAAKTINDYLLDTNTEPEDYDLILTGDLGNTGTLLLHELLIDKYGWDLTPVHEDCGNLIYDCEKQDAHSGGSGCACSGVVVCSKIMRQLREESLRRVLFVGTGALLSPEVVLQGKSIPSIAHAVELRRR